MPRLGQSITRTEPNRRWTAAEEAALVAGVHKHGSGKWQAITTDSDPAIGGALQRRSNVDLKDKWRNMRFSAGSLKRKAAQRPDGRRQGTFNYEEPDGPIRPQPRRIANQDPSGAYSEEALGHFPQPEAVPHMHSAGASADGLAVAAMGRQRSSATSAPLFLPDAWAHGQMPLQPPPPQLMPPPQLQQQQQLGDWLAAAAALPHRAGLPPGGTLQQGLPGNLAYSAAAPAVPDHFAAAFAAANSRAMGQSGLDMSLGLAAPPVPPPMTSNNAAAIQALQQHQYQQLQTLEASGWRGGVQGGGGQPYPYPQQHSAPAGSGPGQPRVSPAAAQEGRLRQQAYLAAANLDVEALAGCLRCGRAFSDTPDPGTGRTPMHAVAASAAVHQGGEAAMRAAGGIIALLLQSGARVEAPDAVGVTPLQLARGSRLAAVLEAAAQAPVEMAARLQQVCLLAPAGPASPGARGLGLQSVASGPVFGGGGGGAAAASPARFGTLSEPQLAGVPSAGGHAAPGVGGPSVADQQAAARAAAAAVKQQLAAAGGPPGGGGARPQAAEGRFMQASNPFAPTASQGIGVEPGLADQGLGLSMLSTGTGSIATGTFGGSGSNRQPPLGLGGAALASKGPAGPDDPDPLPPEGGRGQAPAFRSGPPTLEHATTQPPSASAAAAAAAAAFNVQAPLQQTGQDFRLAVVGPPHTKDKIHPRGPILQPPTPLSSPQATDISATDTADHPPNSSRPSSADAAAVLLPGVHRLSCESEYTSSPWLAARNAAISACMGSNSSSGSDNPLAAAARGPAQTPAALLAADC